MSQRVSHRLRATGRVQRVGFRVFVRDTARAFDIRGWVRNGDDGSVEIAAWGMADNMRSFIEQIEIGPSGSRVDALEIMESDVEMGMDDFMVIG